MRAQSEDCATKSANSQAEGGPRTGGSAIQTSVGGRAVWRGSAWRNAAGAGSKVAETISANGVSAGAWSRGVSGRSPGPPLGSLRQ